ncbi:MAG: hypothetical protein AB7Q17_13855 [Phycisphaerae bacterium]
MRRRFAAASRVLAPALILICGVTAAEAQERLRWGNDVEAGVATAKRTMKPLMFYVTRASDRRDEDLERDQKRAFNDARVAETAKRFVCVQMSSSQHREMLDRWKQPRDYYMYVLFATPEGDLLGQLGAMDVTSAEAFTRKMVTVFRQYRKQIYDQQVKEKVTSGKATPGELKKALDFVREMAVIEADADLVKLLDAKGVEDRQKAQIYDTLAFLATKPATAALFDRAKAGDAAAAKALNGAEPGAAEHLMAALDEDDPAAVRTAYEAVAKMCRVKDIKPARFFENSNERLVKEELQRVKKHAERVVKRWKEQYEEYR